MATANIPSDVKATAEDQVALEGQHLSPQSQHQHQTATPIDMNPNYHDSSTNANAANPGYPAIDRTQIKSIGSDLINAQPTQPMVYDNSFGVQANADLSSSFAVTEQSNFNTTPQQQQQQQQVSPQVSQPIKPLLAAEDTGTSNSPIQINQQVPQQQQPHQSQTQPVQSHLSPQKAIVTKVKLSDELNIFNWLKTTDIINQIAERAKSSVDSVITTLDPGMKEYLYSGGDINIMVISDSSSLVSSIRDAFQSVFGRATVVAAKYQAPDDSATKQHSVKLASGFEQSILMAREIIKRLRADANNVPQNQVVVAIQPSLVQVTQEQQQQEIANSQQWFLTYCMLIEDPVLNASMSSFSQLIPIDNEIVQLAQESIKQLSENFPDKHLGFPKSIDELMSTKLNLKTSPEQDDDVDNGPSWIREWASLDETQVVHHLALILANLYKRKWSECVSQS